MSLYFHGEHVVDKGECINGCGWTEYRMDGECPPCAFAEVR